MACKRLPARYFTYIASAWTQHNYGRLLSDLLYPQPCVRRGRKCSVPAKTGKT